MVWRREVRRLNKQVETLALYKKLKQAADVKRLMTSRPPWAPDMDGTEVEEGVGWGGMDEVEVTAAAGNIIVPDWDNGDNDCDLISPFNRDNFLRAAEGFQSAVTIKEIKPADNGSETTNDVPQSVEQDRPIWQQYPQLKE